MNGRFSHTWLTPNWFGISMIAIQRLCTCKHTTSRCILEAFIVLRIRLLSPPSTWDLLHEEDRTTQWSDLISAVIRTYLEWTELTYLLLAVLTTSPTLCELVHISHTWEWEVMTWDTHRIDDENTPSSNDICTMNTDILYLPLDHLYYTCSILVRWLF